MSIIIKGLNMPEEGDWRTIRIYPQGTCAVVNYHGECVVLNGVQAVELPPHGDLIDRDELKGIIGKFSLSWEYGNGVSDCWDALIEAPTIIEAEVEE